VLLFHRFAGDKEFNPIGLVFNRLRRSNAIGSGSHFRIAKRGEFAPLRQVESSFLRQAGP